MNILSNGSKWAGQKPDSVKTLLGVMKTHALEDISTFSKNRVFGNFKTISHVFNIAGSEKELSSIKSAMRSNWQIFRNN